MANPDLAYGALQKPAKGSICLASKNRRVCSVCQTEKPIVEFYFRRDRMHHTAQCKACFQAKRRSPRPCVECGRTFTGGGLSRFCSRHCQGAHVGKLAAAARRTGSLAWACKFCGKPPSRDFRPATLAGRQYCSKQCEGLGRRKPRRKCRQCGEVAVRGTRQMFCSSRCSGLFRQAKVSRTCVHCQAQFSVPRCYSSRPFCNLKCARAHASKRPQFVATKCEACGTAFRRTAAAIKRLKGGKVFCSLACARGYMQGENNPHYRGGKDPNRGCKWIALAEKIRARDEFRCQRCNCTQEENGQKLSVDHIVPWRSFTDKVEANHPTNLVSLCRRCHAIKTNDYERKWLAGDRIGMEKYRRSINLKPLFAATVNPNGAEASR